MQSELQEDRVRNVVISSKVSLVAQVHIEGLVEVEVHTCAS